MVEVNDYVGRSGCDGRVQLVLHVRAQARTIADNEMHNAYKTDVKQVRVAEDNRWPVADATHC